MVVGGFGWFRWFWVVVVGFWWVWVIPCFCSYLRFVPVGTHQRSITLQPSSSRLVSQGGPVDSLMASFQEDPEGKMFCVESNFKC